jgi:hypothetical protein
MHCEKGENCFYPNFLFLGFGQAITKVLPCDSTIEAIESSIVTKGYGIKLVTLGTTWEIYWEHGGMH